MNMYLQRAKDEIGEIEFDKHIRKIFNKDVLDYVETIIINLPGSCFANCDYCIDKQLRKHSISNEEFISICRQTFDEFPDIKRITLAGGTMPSKHFNYLVNMICKTYPDIEITWNTNGANIDESYLDSIKHIRYINLHRNAINEITNQKIFKAKTKLMTISEAKRLFKEKLVIRVTVDDSFDLDEYISVGTPLYLNKMFPGNDKTNRIFDNLMSVLNIDKKEYRRRNVYINAEYRNIPVRLGLGDELVTHVVGRKPVFLNVCIIHRSGVVSGSWFEDDKVLYKKTY